MANAFGRLNSVTVGNQDVALLESTMVGRGPISDIAVDADTIVVANFGDNSIAVLNAPHPRRARRCLCRPADCRRRFR